MKNVRIGAAMLLVALLPAAAVGQEHRHGADGQPQQQQMMGMKGDSMSQQMPHGDMMGSAMDMRMMSGMMSGMMNGPSPATILRQSETLRLGPDQVKDLEALNNQAQIGRESRMARMAEMHAQMSQALSRAETDIGEYEALLHSMADQQVAMHVQNMKLGQEALRVLSEEQRAKLSSEHMTGHSMMGGEGMGGHPCPMAGETDKGGQ